jgi:beta-glucosidase
VTGAITPRVQYVTVQPDQVVFKPGDSMDLTGKNPWIANDTNSSLEQPHATADNVVQAVNNDQSFADLSRASVNYHSSNPHVASVSSAGKVTMVAHGVATISVTVNGVTGSTPVAVQQPFTLTAPPVVTPGSTMTATTSLPNTAATALRNVTVGLAAPAGWRVTATSPTSFSQVPPGQSAQTTWQITVPAGAQSGPSQLDATATFTDANGQGSVDATSEAAVPYPSLSSAFNNPGISDDASPAAGNLDGGGASYSAQALAAAGITSGGTITHDGLTFTWPNAAPGTADNMVAAGQTIALSGSGKTLGLLGTGDFGTASGTGTVVYTDGTAQQFAVTFSDWWSNQAPAGGDILTTLPYINTPTGKQSQHVSIYYAGVPLLPGKTVQYVTLPDVSSGVSNGTTAMHIFAAAVG